MAKKGFDDATKQARARLLYEHGRAMIAVTSHPENLGSLGASVKLAKAFASLDLDLDDEYAQELEVVEEAFKPENRPKTTDPAQWLRERRLEEYECIIRSVQRQGAWKGFTLEWDDNTL